MNWQNNGFIFEDDGVKCSSPENKDYCQAIYNQNEQKKLRQLQRLKDPKKDQQIQTYLSIVSQFVDLLKSNEKEERTVKSMMAEDCEVFLFNLAEVKPVQYANNHQDFIRVYSEFQILQRDVKELYVDKEKQTVIQICFYRILTEKEKTPMEQFSFEIFSLKNNKIIKYRASFGVGSSFTEFENPFEPTRKDIMLAKIKELNYAWAGQPNLEKVASLLHDSIEYKIWSWENQKGLVFNKHDFATNFKNLEQNYSLKCVVPYEVYSEGQFIIGTYVYHLEGKKELTGQKFMWLSTCIYTFDKDLNIVKVNQQGEIHRENDILIPFIGSSREDLMHLVQSFLEFKQSYIPEWGLVNTDKFSFSFEMSRLGSSHDSYTGTIKGFSEFQKLSNLINGKHRHLEWTKNVDVYIDCYSPNYGVVILIDCNKGSVTNEKCEYSEKIINIHNAKRMCFESGKGTKTALFLSEIPEEIPSPYDDPNFESIHIKRKDNKVC